MPDDTRAPVPRGVRRPGLAGREGHEKLGEPPDGSRKVQGASEREASDDAASLRSEQRRREDLRQGEQERGEHAEPEVDAAAAPLRRRRLEKNPESAAQHRERQREHVPREQQRRVHQSDPMTRRAGRVSGRTSAHRVHGSRLAPGWKLL